jgi:lauroyl/myristoyl acyltransferase
MTDAHQPTGSWRGRFAARLLAGTSLVACRMPERLAVRLAELAGDLWYRSAGAKRTLARDNLRRVVTWMAAEQAGDPAAWPAATDPRRLERLVRSAFRHYARNYLETMRAPIMGGAYVRERTTIEDPAVVDAAFAETGPVIFVGLHFGSLELPGFYLIERSGRPVTAPMEQVDDPAIQAWFVRTRGVIGVRIVGIREARRELAGALERGEIAGLIADRDITGGGVEVPSSASRHRSRPVPACSPSSPTCRPSSPAPGGRRRATTGDAWSGSTRRPAARGGSR